MRVLTFANQKGGVGKTACAVSVGAALAEADRRVLLVDLDPQGHATDALGAAPAEGEANLARALLGEWSGELGELVRPVADLWLVPTCDAMFLLEPQLYPRSGREWLLTRFLNTLVGMVDDVLIDCPPSLGALTDNALVAARDRDPDDVVSGQLVIPVQAEDSSIRALSLLLRQIATLHDGVPGIGSITPAGLVINGYDRRRGRVAVSTRAAFEQYQLPVLATIADRKDIREAWRLHQTVLAHAPHSDQAEAFRALARTLTPELATTTEEAPTP